MRKIIVILAFIVGLYGCAGTKFYKEEAGSGNSDKTLKETGIPFYPPKPYLLIARTGEKDKPVSASIIYLPDTSKPLYAVPKSGIGSANLTLGFSNGILTSFGQQTDPKITELITSFAGVPGLLANAAKTRAETSNLREQSADRPGLATKVKGIADSLTTLKAARGYSAAFDTSDQQKIVNAIKDLTDLSGDINNPDKELAPLIVSLESKSKSLSSIKPSDTPPQGDAANVWNQLKTIQSKLQELVIKEKPKSEPEPVVELYEIVITDGKTALKAATVE